MFNRTRKKLQQLRRHASAVEFDFDNIQVEDYGHGDDIDCNFIYPFTYKGIQLDAVLKAFAYADDDFVFYSYTVHDKSDKLIAGSFSADYEADKDGFYCDKDCAEMFIDQVEKVINEYAQSGAIDKGLDNQQMLRDVHRASRYKKRSHRRFATKSARRQKLASNIIDNDDLNLKLSFIDTLVSRFAQKSKQRVDDFCKIVSILTDLFEHYDTNNIPPVFSKLIQVAQANTSSILMADDDFIEKVQDILKEAK